MIKNFYSLLFSSTNNFIGIWNDFIMLYLILKSSNQLYDFELK